MESNSTKLHQNCLILIFLIIINKNVCVLIVTAEGICARWMLSNLILRRILSIRRVSISSRLFPILSIMIKSMISWRDLILIWAPLMAMGLRAGRGMMFKDLFLRICFIVMDPAQIWVHTGPNFPDTKVTTNTWSQQTNIHEDTSLWGVSQHTVNNSTTNSLKRMTTSISLISWRLGITGLARHRMEIFTVILILSIWRRRWRF